jgi:aryl-alcohol dehydrogenase-like predicted oxidoreductase
MIPTLKHFGVGCIPWSPIARGFLARPVDNTTKTTRQETDAAATRFVNSESEASREINKRVEKVAKDLGKSMAQVAYAWTIQQDYVDAPIIGSTKMDHLVEAIGKGKKPSHSSI